jgi:hypothetical protein
MHKPPENGQAHNQHKKMSKPKFCIKGYINSKKKTSYLSNYVSKQITFKLCHPSQKPD